MKSFGYFFLLILFSVGTATAQQRFVAALGGNQEVPANASTAKGTCAIVLNAAQTQITVNCTFSGLGSNANAAHIHAGAVGVAAPVLFGFSGVPAATSGTIPTQTITVTPAQVASMRAHLHYVNIHTTPFPGGEIRGQIKQAHTTTDYDGDGRSDATIFRQSTNTFWIKHSLNSGFTTITHGSGTGDIHLNNTADFDGDGRGDPLLIKLVGNLAMWSIYQTDTNTVRTETWGDFSAASADTLAISDYDGDGKQDPAVFRRSTGDWWYIESASGLRTVKHWGTVNDFPAAGDYDGDGKADLTAVRVESGNRVWYILNSSDGTSRRVTFGASATDGLFFFAPFDIDGDSKQDIAVNRTTAGQRVFHILRSSDGAYTQIAWGGAGAASTALFGDYDGDGKTDLVARISGAEYLWQVLRSSDGGIDYIYWGTTGDRLIDGGGDGDFDPALVQSGPSPEL